MLVPLPLLAVCVAAGGADAKEVSWLRTTTRPHRPFLRPTARSPRTPGAWARLPPATVKRRRMPVSKPPRHHPISQRPNAAPVAGNRQGRWVASQAERGRRKRWQRRRRWLRSRPHQRHRHPMMPRRSSLRLSRPCSPRHHRMRLRHMRWQRLRKPRRSKHPSLQSRPHRRLRPPRLHRNRPQPRTRHSSCPILPFSAGRWPISLTVPNASSASG